MGGPMGMGPGPMRPPGPPMTSVGPSSLPSKPLFPAAANQVKAKKVADGFSD